MARSGFGRNNTIIRGTDVFQNAVGNIGSVFSSKEEAKYHSGARCVLKINGKLMFAFAVSWSIQTDNVEIKVIDNYLPAEIAPRFISVSGTLGSFVIPGRSPTAEVLQSNTLSFLMNKYIVIEVYDSATGSILFKTDKAVITSQQTSIQAEQLSVTQLSWKAIGWQAESPPKPPAESGNRDATILNGITDAFKNLKFQQ